MALPTLSLALVSKKIPISKVQIYEGLLFKNNQNYSLVLSNSTEQYDLIFDNDVSEQIVQRLTTGDFISLHATNLRNGKLNILDINFVGLNLLLGIWLGDDNVCYHFKNFTTFLIFNPTKSGTCIPPIEPLNPKQTRKMSYFINPDSQDLLLLISDKTAQYAAELLIKNPKNIQFNLFDDRTGAIVSKVILRR
jgi:hypothetical protein